VSRIRVGTCSWTDKTMVEAWYPQDVKSAEARLRYYAERFDTVEVDSTYYGLPSEKNAELWAERTPPGFVFHIKAFGMLTRHGVRPQQLPAPLRSAHDLGLDRYGRIVRPPDALREEVFSWFSSALTPLRDSGRLGLILMQFPPYFTAESRNRDYIARAAARLAPDPVAVEFRHSSWVADETLHDTLAFLGDHGLTYVCVDEPRLDSPTVLPPVAAATAPIAYVRFHGRNASTWNARVGSAAERFRYLYTDEELAEWTGTIRTLATEADTTYVMFNNCYADYAPRNAHQLSRLLDLSADTG
jgi:uncharacterized protein YecE (DUF72 family)